MGSMGMAKIVPCIAAGGNVLLPVTGTKGRCKGCTETEMCRVLYFMSKYLYLFLLCKMGYVILNELVFRTWRVV